MNWIEAKVIFESENTDLAEELISNIFYKLNLKGVIIENPNEERGSEWGDDAEEKPSNHSVTGYLVVDEEIEEKRALLESEIIFPEELNIKCRVTYTTVNEEDWAESWKEYFWPEKITDNITVKPSWREYSQKEGEIVIEIDPGMAFGTGTHGTTSLCIEAIDKHLKPSDTFLDIGTGSGILMIAAAKKGASYLFGVDNDGIAVAIAEKNLRLNKIDENFEIVKGDLSKSVDKSYDFVAANILAEVVIVLIPDVPRVLNKDGLFLASGIISEKKDAVLSTLKENGFDVVEVKEKDSWVSIVSRKI
ncbi:MAG: 50S ribosomal protein L11 methyltransferase [Desulfobacterales bacterium]|nr:50S ribosomal protein L11 methyltransferase [Desulfobacterales bacterium]MCP4162324.1 50S ribosomal protein L11 methyltransferase [Deltaproteobacteria bacterium]